MGVNRNIPDLPKPPGVNGNTLLEGWHGGKNVRILLSTIKDFIFSTFNPDYITFNTDPPVVTDAGTLVWNKQEYTIDIITGLGATIQVGHEMLLLYYNDTGATILNGSILHPKSGTTISGFPVPTPDLAYASTWELSEGTLSVATHDILNGEIGLATRFGRVRGLDTTTYGAGEQLWLSDTVPGGFTITKPVFPCYAISMGGTLNSDAVDGEIFVTITKSVEDTFNDSWDGAIRESFNFTVNSDGAIITATLENINPAMDLTLLFSDGNGFYTLDTTTVPLTIALTAGTDELTTTNYVYIPIATKVLTISTSGFPVTEHCKVAQLEVQSATGVQTKGGTRRNQNINDHIKQEDDNGHILHIAERIRQLNAEHDNGTEGSLTGTPTNGYIQVTSGQVWQMHKQTYPSMSMPTDSILIVNDFNTAYRDTINLNTITEYSDGSSWSNQWGSVVIWGVINKSGEPSVLMGNLPSGGYNSEATAVSDSLSYSDYTIPSKYKGVGFLIGRYTVRISGGTITYNSGVGYQDLRGFIPNNIAGGGGGGGGVTSYLGLDDTPSTRVGQANKLVAVNGAETADEYTDNISGNKGLNNSDIESWGVGFGALEAFQSAIMYSKTSDAIYIMSNAYFDGTNFRYKDDGFANIMFLENGQTQFRYVASGLADNIITWSVSFTINNTGTLLIEQPPSTDTGINDILTWNSTSKAIEKRSNTYTSLTPGAAVAFDLSTGLNKILNVSVDSTITFSNFVSGMQGDIRVSVTTSSTITLAAGGVTFFGVGNLASLAIGVYHIAYTVISGTIIDYNINAEPYA